MQVHLRFKPLISAVCSLFAIALVVVHGGNSTSSLQKNIN